MNLCLTSISFDRNNLSYDFKTYESISISISLFRNFKSKLDIDDYIRSKNTLIFQKTIQNILWTYATIIQRLK